MFETYEELIIIKMYLYFWFIGARRELTQIILHLGNTLLALNRWFVHFITLRDIQIVHLQFQVHLLIPTVGKFNK